MDVQVSYVDADGVERSAPVENVGGVFFENAIPVRSFPSFKGQRNYPGFWWSASSARHVGFESWLERDTAMMLDFDPQIVAFSSQPFWMSWRDEGRRSHAPDWFARLSDGTGLVVDCRPPGRAGPRDEAAFEMTARVCEYLGWRFRLVREIDPVQRANVRWLSCYRHPRHLVDLAACRLVEVFAEPTPLLAGAGLAGDPLAVLPVLFHLLWTGVLTTDLSRLLSERSLVVTAGS
ncbi:hypothetical protein ABH926_008815 [Catenulispora sp. GP43]|uniref:TnsA-like heteromeric transposase endonuclease subunit n=1 Tax=Catenulispora sp. GP43 TaxID=3156263 RepID=UPI003512A5CE